MYGFDKAPYRKLVNEALDLLAEGGSKTLQSAMQSLDNYINGDYIYDTHLEALKNELITEINAFKSESGTTSVEASAPDVTPAPDDRSRLGLLLALGAVAAAAAAATALILIIKKKK